MRWAQGSLALLLLLLPYAGSAAAAATRIELDAPADVRGLRLADADGDGITDLLLVDGRTVRVYRGRKDGLPAAKPTWICALPSGVSFVDVAPPRADGRAVLIGFGREGAQQVPLDGVGTPASVPGGDALAWRDATKVTFTDLSHPGGAVLLPRRDGWLYRKPGREDVRLVTTPYRTVLAPGPFLEDTCESIQALPDVFLGTPATAGSAAGACLWSIDGHTLVAQAADGRVAYDLSFLEKNAGSGRVEQRLVDLDGDGRPELFHRVHTNQETRYGFFRTRPAESGHARGPTHRPATSALYLSGYQFDPDLEDVNGDGLPDLTVTGIAINPVNTLRAMTTGKVTAETATFLNCWGDGKGRYFPNEADAVVKSDVRVNVRFNYAGTIEVERFFTIMVDGDLDGDGRKDLVIRTSDDTLTVRRGAASGVWAAEGAPLAIPPRGAHPDIEGYTADLDGIRGAEIVLLYRKPPGGRDRVGILRGP